MIAATCRKAALSILLAVVAPDGTALAQNGDGAEADSADVQFWTDISATKRLSSRFTVDSEAGFRTVTSGTDANWTKIYTRGTFRFRWTSWLRLAGGLFLDWEDQLVGPNSVELRPFAGLTLTWNARPRLTLDNYTRIEWRNFFYSDGTSDHSARLRSRFRVTFSINRARLIDDGTLAAVADIEGFGTIGEDITESFGATRRLQVGATYRLSYAWRFRLLYTNQQSRTTVGDSYESTSHIIRFRALYYIP